MGDVMAESRGRKEDLRLKESFRRIYQDGTDYLGPPVVREFLTSGELKVANKREAQTGLEIADLLAHPSFRATLARHEGQPLATNFGGRIARILESVKYRRSSAGQISGWGRKWLP